MKLTPFLLTSTTAAVICVAGFFYLFAFEDPHHVPGKTGLPDGKIAQFAEHGRPRMETGPHEGRTAADFLQAMEESRSERDEDTFISALTELIHIAPEQAASYVTGLPDNSLRKVALHTLVGQWASASPEAVIEWMITLDGVSRDSALTYFCNELVDSRPVLALSQAIHFERSDLVPLLMQQWAARDFAVATAWVEDAPESAYRNDAYCRMASMLAAQDPTAAADLVFQHIPPGSAQSEAAIAVLHEWGKRDIDAAKQWVKQFPAGPLRERAEAELAGIAFYLQNDTRPGSPPR